MDPHPEIMAAAPLPQPLPNIEFVTYSATFASADPNPLDAIVPGLLASANWRDVYGKILRDRVCRTHLPKCKDCVLLSACLYSHLYETPRKHSNHIFDRLPNSSNPYVFRAAPLSNKDGSEDVTVHFTQFGAVADQALLLLDVLMETGWTRKWKLPARYRLRSIAAGAGGEIATPVEASDMPVAPASLQSLPPCPDTLHVNFDTPLVIRVKNRDIRARDLRFRQRSISIRAAALSRSCSG